MTVSRATEIELKYAVGDGIAVPALDGLLVEASGAAAGRTTVRAVPPVALEAVYFDSADRTLLAAHIALRRRTGGHDAGWHVKLPAAKGRVELHAPIDPAAPDALPAGLERALRTRLRGRPPVPIARIRTTRTALIVGDARGERVEMVDDAVTATDLAAGTVRSWREWEAEQIGDDPAAAARVLAAVDPALLAAGAAPSASPAKLAQALGLVGLPRADVAPTTAKTAGAALAGLLVPLVEQLHRDALALADGSDDDVHRMRKTLRRVRSVLALRPVAGPTGRDLRDRLRDFGAPLGAVRDPVVAADLAAGLLAGVDHDLPGVDDALARLVLAPRQAAGPARLAVGEAIAAADTLPLYAALEAYLTAPTGGGGPDGPLAAEPPEALRRLAKATLRRAAHRARRVGPDLETLHDARKAARRARFVIEAFVDGGLVAPGSRTARLAAAAERVQDSLGAHRDLAVLVSELPQRAAEATGNGENAFVYGVVAERGAHEAERLRRRALRRLRRFAAAARR